VFCGERRLVINGFVAGCTGRISSRLEELIAQSKVVASSNSRALVVTKTAAIKGPWKRPGSGKRLILLVPTTGFEPVTP
jgi:hypothetical protein